MAKRNITMSVDENIYKNFQIECLKSGLNYSKKIEKFMQGFAENHKINDFLTFEQETNPKIDIPYEEIINFTAKCDKTRIQELLFKVQEWQGVLQKA